MDTMIFLGLIDSSLEMRIFSNIINVFIVHFKYFNASFLNKSINILKNKVFNDLKLLSEIIYKNLTLIS